jgi:hypothetical protein
MPTLPPVSTRKAMFVPPACAMRFKLVRELPTPMTKVWIFCGPFSAAAAMLATSWGEFVEQPSGSPSVASTTTTFRPGFDIAQVVTYCIEPSSAGRVGVPPPGLCVVMSVATAAWFGGSTSGTDGLA